MPISYRDKQFAESPRARVIITQVNLQSLVATGVARGNEVQYIIHLDTAVGSTWIVPKIGEEWIITRAANAWALERRGSLQSQGALVAKSSLPGSTVVDGDLVVSGDIIPPAPITTGIDWNESSDWAVTEYWLRQRAGWAATHIVLTYSGATAISPGSDGNITDANGIATFPSDWRPAPPRWLVDGARNGLAGWQARLNNNGTFDLTAGTPGASISSGQTIEFDFGFPV